MVMVRASAPVYLIMEARTRDARGNPVCGVLFTPRSHLDGVAGNRMRRATGITISKEKFGPRKIFLSV